MDFLSIVADADRQRDSLNAIKEGLLSAVIQAVEPRRLGGLVRHFDWRIFTTAGPGAIESGAKIDTKVCKFNCTACPWQSG